MCSTIDMALALRYYGHGHFIELKRYFGRVHNTKINCGIQFYYLKVFLLMHLVLNSANLIFFFLNSRNLIRCCL